MSYNRYRLASEISKAILRGETSMQIEHEIFNLPECQKTGTYWQRKTHADEKAVEFLENIHAQKKKEKE